MLLEIRQRFINFRSYAYFAWLALWFPSKTFTLAMLAAHRAENDSIIMKLIENSGKVHQINIGVNDENHYENSVNNNDKNA